MKLDNLIRELLIETGETSLHKYPIYLQHGLSGLREFNMDTGVPKVALLTVNSNDTVDLPSDYIAYTQIAVCDVNGNLKPLGINRKMCALVADKCGNLQANDGTPGTALFENWEGGDFRNGQDLGRKFGLGGGTSGVGYYKVDERGGYIALQGVAASKIMLEYVADLERNQNGEFAVHPYLVEAIKSWIYWRMMQRNARIPANEKMLAKEDYLSAKSKAKRRLASFTIEEAYQAIRKAFTPSPKI